MIGKPYSGKLNVRFDEGELEIEPSLLRQLSTLPYPPPGNRQNPQAAEDGRGRFPKRDTMLYCNWGRFGLVIRLHAEILGMK